MENKSLVVDTKAEGNVLTLEFDQKFPEVVVKQLAAYITEGVNNKLDILQAKMDSTAETSEKNINAVKNEVRSVKETVKSKHISPQDLDALQSLVDKKARKYVDKSKGIQLNIEVFLNYDAEGLKEFQELVNKEYGRTKKRIWVELNKECLHRKGTAPKKRMLDTHVEQAFDFVRTWGGFSI